MATYVTSLKGTLAHEGDESAVLCRFVPRGPFRVTDAIPSGYLPCPRCADRAASLARTLDRARARARAAARDTAVVALLAEGLTDAAAARRLGLGKRTFSRHVGDAMRRAGTCSRFQWAFNEGVRMASTRRP